MRWAMDGMKVWSRAPLTYTYSRRKENSLTPLLGLAQASLGLGRDRRCDEMYRDLREFIAAVDKLGALRRIEGADPRFEIGGITEVAAGRPDCPALLFDAIKGVPPGFRIFTNATTNVQRASLALGL